MKKYIPGSKWRLSAYKDEGIGERVRLENKGIFDELVIDDWFHLEQMNTNQWWLRIEDFEFDIEIKSNGRAKVFSRQSIKKYE